MSRNVRLILTVVATITSIILCCLGAGVYWDGYYLPNKPCRPITYPDAKQTTSSFTYTSDESINTLLQFYDQQLNVQAIRTEYGEWAKEQLTSLNYLYSCYSNDVNGMTTETGCIYISSDGVTSYIKTEFFRSEGGHIPCAR